MTLLSTVICPKSPNLKKLKHWGGEESENSEKHISNEPLNSAVPKDLLKNFLVT